MFLWRKWSKLIKNGLFSHFYAYLEPFGSAQQISTDLPKIQKIGPNCIFNQNFKNGGKWFFVESDQILIKNYLFSHFSSYLEVLGRA